MKLLIDTNVILDALMDRDPYAEFAKNLLLAVAEEKVQGYITASVFTDLYYLLQKYLKDSAKTREVLTDLIEVVDILDVTGSDCEKAFDLPMNDYEDALLAQCAKRNKMNHIVTRDQKHFMNSPIAAISPEDTVKMF